MTLTQILNSFLNIKITGSRTATLQDSITSMNVGSAIDCTDMASGLLVISGTFTGTVQLSGKLLTIWTPIPVVDVQTGKTIFGTINRPGTYYFSCRGYSSINVPTVTFIEGTLSAIISVTPFDTFPLQKEVSVSIEKTITKKYTASPKAELELTDVIDCTIFGETIIPYSIGYDNGFIYGCSKVNKRLVRVENSFATKSSVDLIYGNDFTEDVNFIGTISHVEKTYAGYVVIELISGSPNTSNIWFSESFDSGFTKVLTLDRGRINTFNFSVHHSKSTHNNVMMVSEYVSTTTHIPGQESRLFISKDGGQTWSLIFTLPTGTDQTASNHIHTHCYDPYDARIWLSNGDGRIHASLRYSPDMGINWYIVPYSDYIKTCVGSHPQPTILIPLPDRIAMCPDNGLPSGILSIYKDRKFQVIGQEKFDFEYQHAAYARLSSANGAYVMKYIRSENEIYLVTRSLTGYRQSVIIASGDNGVSWHNVASINMEGYVNANNINSICGIDVNGYMYILFAGTQIAKFKKAAWISS